MPKFVAELSEEDDEVIVVPYVKPTPPMIVLSASEDEDENEPDQSNAPSPKAKENVSRSSSSGSSGSQRVRRDVPSQVECGKGSRRKEKKNKSQNENVVPNQSSPPRNIFHPSETAIMDTSRTSTPNGSVEGSPVPSPSSSSTAQGRKGKGSHSNLVKEQFASFLKGINLPPPPPKGRPSKTATKEKIAAGTSEETTMTTEETTAESISTPPQPPPPETEVQGFVSVTPEKSMRGAKEKRVGKTRKTSTGGDKPSKSREKSKTPLNLQYNLTTTPLDLDPEKTKAKGTKRTKKGTESEPGAKVTKKRKKESSSAASTSEKEKPKRNSVAKAKRKEKEPSLDLNYPGFPTHWTNRMKEFYGTMDKKNFTLQSIMSRQPQNAKYWLASEHKEPRKRGREPCEICKRWDHRSHNCPIRGMATRCVYCSSKDHRQESCTVGICLFCGTRQDVVMRTCRNCLDRREKKPSPCSICDVAGHDKDACPDNWRKYHSTTIDVEQLENDLVVLKDKLRNRLKDKQGLLKEIERHSKPNASRTRSLEKAESTISKLEEKIKDFEDKIKQGKESPQVVDTTVHLYAPKYQQYCCNCGSKGHNYINCKADRPRWTQKHRIVPNKPYLTVKKPVFCLDTNPSSIVVSSTQGNRKISEKCTSTSQEGQQRQGGRRVVFDEVEVCGFVTIDVTNEASKEPQPMEKPAPKKPSRAPPQEDPMDIHHRETPSRSVPPQVDHQESHGPSSPPPPPPLLGPDTQIPWIPPPATHSGAEPEFYEDHLPTSFDEGPRLFMPPPPPPPLFGFHPRMPFPPPHQPYPHPRFSNNVPPPRPSQIWRDGIGRIQYPPRREIIQVPVPIPVSQEDYERLQREGFPAQFQFPQFYQAMANLYPHHNHQQIPPTQFPPTMFGGFQQGPSEMNFKDMPETMRQGPAFPPGREEDPPSPDSTENLPAANSAHSPAGSGSSEIEFLGEVLKEKSAPTPPKSNGSIPTPPEPVGTENEDHRRHRDDNRHRDYRDYERDRDYRHKWNRDRSDRWRDDGAYSDSRRGPYGHHDRDRNYRESNRGGNRHDHRRGHGTDGPSPQRPYLPHHHARRARRYFDSK